MQVRDEVLDVAFVSAEEMGLVDELKLMTGLRINPMIAPLSIVESRLDALYRSEQHTKDITEGTGEFDTAEGVEDSEGENILDLDASPAADANGRIVRMVNQILEQASCAMAPATSTLNRSRTVARSGSGSTASSMRSHRRRKALSSCLSPA